MTSRPHKSAPCRRFAKHEKQIRTKTSELPHSAESRKDNTVPLSKGHNHAMVAKTLAKENLMHQPLPDNFDNDVHKICNDNGCKDTKAVGCKCYGVPGPTQCSKIKVYRPKTAHELQREPARSSSCDQCPMDSVKADKKELYSDIDYAICWDLCPPGHKEHQKPPHLEERNGSLAPAVFTLVPSRDPSPCLYEPKRDGLHSPKPPRVLSSKCCPKPNQNEEKDVRETKWIETTTPVNPSAVMTIVKKPESEENFFSYKQTPLLQQKARCSSCTSLRSRSRKKQETNPKPWTSENSMGPSRADYQRLLDRRDTIEQRLRQRNIHSSSPILAELGQANGIERNINYNHQELKRNSGGSHPEICTHQSDLYNQENTNGKEYKCHCFTKNNHQQANQNDQNSANGRKYKCHCMTTNEDHKTRPKTCNGSVHSNNSRSLNSSASSNSRKNGLNPPKLKNHVTKKSYSIPTLSPPFTLWPGTTGQDYPGHWRLVSVYQHSYRPIEMRKRNLLKCIYQ